MLAVLSLIVAAEGASIQKALKNNLEKILLFFLILLSKQLLHSVIWPFNCN